METRLLKIFSQGARKKLQESVGVRLDAILKLDTIEVREQEAAVRALKEEIDNRSREEVIKYVAYVWFNRFCALRFMDVNNYSIIGVVSPAQGFIQPEILQDAKQGHIPDELSRYISKKHVFDLLQGNTPSRNAEQEAYKLLLVGVCNYYNTSMPFMFEKIADYTELLMSEDLISESSILTDVRNAMTVDTCKDIEVIGWLYQFYISEKKDEVFANLKKKKKIATEDIPAATQLFTPHWIVQYLVENSLGRLWMLNNPDSRLINSMEYYIRLDEENREEFLKINSPEEIKVCDPACGSGHMLVYAFDILYKIYEETGYDAKEIPSLILQKNLFGIEIDERAGELAAFALMMKARGVYRRYFTRGVPPNVKVLKNYGFENEELKEYMEFVGEDLFTAPLRDTLRQFENAATFGSLIIPKVQDVEDVYRILKEKNLSEQLFLKPTHEKVLKVLEQADYLSQKYQVVIANPPYMGGKGMNDRLKGFAKNKFPDSKSDLCVMFIERSLKLTCKQGLVSMITMQSWMFLSSYEKLREKILDEDTIVSMLHLGPRAFDSIGGEVVSTTAFVFNHSYLPNYRGAFIRLIDGKNEAEKRQLLKIALKE